MNRFFPGALVALACSSAAAAPLAAGDSARVWAKCSACHSAEPGVQGMLGPNLNGLIGRKVGTIGGYSYSPAMQKADFVWDAAMLDTFLKAPIDTIPGTRMAFLGLKDSKDRAALVRFLESKSR